ncbi:MAG: LCP family protein [Candidatus Dojkabacteria bacterium]|jgi:LCP family protein required for cell wall assembly|nr:LCP family protein [Candidatus Dojkabacteria bacterium]
MEVSINMSDKELAKTKIPRYNGVRTKKKTPWLLVVLAIFLIGGITSGIYLLYKGYKVSSDIGFQFTPTNILKPEAKPELKKDSTGKYTNVLLIGVDTREKGNLMNTDTIIVASFNHDTKDIVMVSIPRDFHVQVNRDKYWFNKINSAYAVNEQKKKDSGLLALRDIVEQMTGMEIQYHAMIDFNGFVQLIDAVGGVYVNVENSFTDYMYPKGSRYETISFKSGPQLMDGTTALKYSRSRHSMHNNEGTDFARARRQQKVIIAFKDLVLSSETLLNPKKIMDLMSAIQNNIKISEFTLDDIEAGVNLLKEFDEKKGNTYSFVLDPSAGNSSLITSQNVVNTGAYAIGPIEGLGKYDNIKEYVDLILKNPQLYSEDPSIYTYNTGLGYQNTYNETQSLRKDFKYLDIKFIGNLYSDKEGVYIFSNKEDSFEYSVNQLSKYFKPTGTTKPEYITTKLRGEDISILFGKEISETNSDISTSQ